MRSHQLNVNGITLQTERRCLPREAAAILGLNPDQVMTRIRSGKIRAVNVAGKQARKCLSVPDKFRISQLQDIRA